MKMTRVLGLMTAALFWWTLSGAEAACTGSGQAWSCTAGTSPSQINSTLQSASDGATLTFDAGSYTWGGGTAIAFLPTKGVTLICASQGACSVSWAGDTFHLPTISSTRLYRISGFAFNHPSGGGQFIWSCRGGSCGRIVLSQVRIDHNSFTLGGQEQIFQSDSGSSTYLYGVFDHNTVNITTQTATKFDWPNTVDATPVTGRLGASSNLFIEDNVFNINAATSQAVPCLDGWGTALGTVWRFNTITNCRLALHGVVHNWGPSNWEAYGNAFVMNSSAAFPGGYRTVHHQGSGTYAVWGNTFNVTSHDPNTIVVLHYRGFQPAGAPDCNGTDPQDGNRAPTTTYQGYPCFHQPGRDWDGLLYPMFAFLNRWTDNGAKTDMVLNGGGTSPDYSGLQVRSNRDLYNAVSASAQTSATSPFNGTTGIGYGTLANRPTTCATTTEAADAGRGGVMYWATDQGSWNTSTSNPQGVQQNGNSGVLYMCTATNTWSVYYTPYTYPHPLQSGASPPGGGGSVPTAPSNLRIVP
jgi:hypothetical protein